MEKIKCYIINLENKIIRREHIINKIIPNLMLLDIEIITAIDGNLLEENKISESFNVSKYNKRNLWQIKVQEIGCCLSHRECYKHLIDTNESYAMILEDDINPKINMDMIYGLINYFMKSHKPRILLLSGWFWYYNAKKINSNYKFCKVFDARLAHSYLINREAANIILKEKPWYLADDWREIKKMGIEIYGISPHFIDPEIEIAKASSISIGLQSEYNFKLLAWLINKKRGLIRRTLKKVGLFEKEFNKFVVK